MKNRCAWLAPGIALLLCFSGCAVEQTMPAQEESSVLPRESSQLEIVVEEQEESLVIERAGFRECGYESELYNATMAAGPVGKDYLGQERQELYTFQRESFQDGAFSIALPSFMELHDPEESLYKSYYVPYGAGEDAGECPVIFSFQCFRQEIELDQPAEEIEIEGRNYHYIEFSYEMDGQDFAQISAWTPLNDEVVLYVLFSARAEDMDTWTVLFKSVLASVRDREETLRPEIQREMNVVRSLGRSLELYTLDLSVPPAERTWQIERVSSDAMMTYNELLWIVRGERDVVGLPEMGTIDDSIEDAAFRVNITDPDFEGDYEYFNNLCMTLSGGYLPTTYNIVITRNGEKIPSLPYYEGTDYFQFTPYEYGSTSIYTAQELKEFREGIPYPKDRLYSGRYLTYLYNGKIRMYPSENQETDAHWNQMSLLEQELNLFISSVLPNGYIDYTELSFHSPSQAPDEFIMRSVLRSAPVVTLFPGEDAGAQSSEEYVSVVASPYYNVVLENHFEQTARMIYGEGFTIAHQSLGGKTWSYNRYYGCYSHFPGGTGDGYLYLGDYPVILGYEDNGDTYKVTIALTNSTLSDLVGLEDPTIGPEQTQTIIEESPQAVVTLRKLGDNRFNLLGFEYIG